MDNMHYILNILVMNGYASVLNSMTIELMYIHYMEVCNTNAFNQWLELVADKEKNPFTYPFGK